MLLLFFAGEDNKYDRRLKDNKETFLTRLIHEGTTTENKTSKIKFSFPNYPDYLFGNQPIIFESDRIPYGPVVDVRKGMALTPDPTKLELPLIDVPAGTTGEYGTGILDIGTRLLADLNDDGIVNLIDYAIFANYWRNHLKASPAVSCVANISGPNGIPDGYNGKAVVDEIDLGAFAEEWLMDANDPASW